MQKNENNFSYTSLEAIRSKLLDLTKINNLISFKFSNASSLRFIECNLENTLESLLKGEQLNLIPVPDPTDKELIEAGILRDKQGNILEKPSAEQWAKHIGFNTNYDLYSIDPDVGTKFNNKLQTLFFADALNSFTKKTGS